MPGFSWTELYVMPINLRRFYFHATVDKIKKYNLEVEKQNKNRTNNSPKMPRMPKYK